jgi:hypothetical protein
LYQVFGERTTARPYFQQVTERVLCQLLHNALADIFVFQKMLSQRFFQCVHCGKINRGLVGFGMDGKDFILGLFLCF